MSTPVHPDLVPGWLIDEVLDERAHTVVVAARGAEPVLPPAHPRFATIVIARPGHQDAAERELDDLVAREVISRADIAESTIVMWDGRGVVARVLHPFVSYDPASATDAPMSPMAPVLEVIETIDDRLDALSPSSVRRGAYAAIALALVAVIVAVFVALPNGSAKLGVGPADRVGEVAWDPGTAVASVEQGDRVLTYRLGEPGDELLLGDWEGTGARHPALYRPSTGEIWLFMGWATADTPAEPRVAAQGPVHGRAVVVRRDGRDYVEVTPRSG